MSAHTFSDVVVHVGYHKAGSTLLQHRLFTSGRGVFSEWSQEFYHRNILLARPDRTWAERVRAAFVPGINEARDRGLVPVLSCEALSGDMWRLGQANGYGNFHVADALATAFPEARIMMLHREQTAMVASLYKHSLRSHWRYSLDEFMDQSPLNRGMAPILNFGYLEYSWLLAHYLARFERRRVLALPFELVRQGPEWARTLSSFLGIEVQPEWFVERENPGFAAATTNVKRFMNYLIPDGAEPNGSPIGRFVNSAAYQMDSRLPARCREFSDHKLRVRVGRLLGTAFDADNARLAQLTGEDWSQYGYRT